MLKLGVFAAEGIAQEKNPETAKKWLTQARELGNTDAEQYLKDYGLSD